MDDKNKNADIQETTKKIKHFWDEKASVFQTDPRATLGDPILRDIEVREIAKFVDNGQKILDCGCGNGTSSLQIASQKRVTLIGIDYSEAMIEMANKNLDEFKHGLKGDVRFEPGDILDLKYEDETFDVIITMRCLQNLPNFELQKKAILSLKRLLKTGGRLLMLECSNDGLHRLNRLLVRFGKEVQSPPWHNLFFNDQDLIKLSRAESFPLIKVINVSGVFQLIALCIYYPLRRIAKYLPSSLDVGYHKLYVWEKQS